MHRNWAKFLFFRSFWILSTLGAFLALGYGYVVFRSFNFDSIDMRIETALLAIWQLTAFIDYLSKHCPIELVYTNAKY